MNGELRPSPVEIALNIIAFKGEGLVQGGPRHQLYMGWNNSSYPFIFGYL